MVLVNRIGFLRHVDERPLTPELQLQGVLQTMATGGHRIVSVTVLPGSQDGEAYEVYIVSEFEVMT